MLTNPQNLIVYSASAGSGKTYTLTGEYLRLLFQGMLDGEGVKYDSILVATFTNKATVELRERILNLLRDLSQGRSNRASELIEKLEWKGNPSEEKKQKELRKYAGIALESILEDYGKFRVQTIDSFFQEVVRSFTLELSSVRGGFEVEIDTNMVMQLSLDRLIDELQNSDSEHAEMLAVLEEIYRESAEEGARVDLRKEFTKLLKPLIDGKQKQTLDELYKVYLDKDRIDRARASLREIAQRLPSKVDQALASLQRIRETYGLDYKDSSRGILQGLYDKLERGEGIDKIADGTLINATIRGIMENARKGDERAWCAKSKSADVHAAYHAVSGELLAVLDALDIGESEEFRAHTTADIMLRFLNWMPAILKFKQSLDKFQQENNIVLISEINPLLSDIIDGSEIPFIYEKVGSYIEHYMLDEFQDTSHVQWDNFTPLLNESLGNDRKNYLVGDVKQSIYRFRGADSTLLGSMISAEPTLVDLKSLPTNYRSADVVVDFNNRFFSGIYDFESFFEAEQSVLPGSIYCGDNVKQKKDNNKEVDGYVRITSTKEPMTKDQLHTLLQELYHDQYRPGDITLLFRKGDEAVEVARWLRELGDSEDDPHSYDFVSDEALALNSSPAVWCLVALVHYLAHPGDTNALSLLHLSLFTLLGCDADRTDEAQEELLALSSTGLSIYETITEAVTLLEGKGSIKPEDRAYVAAYMDQLFNYTARFTPTYLQFDNWWQVNGDSLYIEMPEEAADCIRLMTIHKAKGLEFPVVILPFATWDMLPNPSTKRVVLMDKPADLPGFPEDLPLYYLRESPRKDWEMKSYFRTQYLEEQEQLYMDNLNLLYVAFTRASERLYAYTTQEPENTKGDEKKSVGRLINLRIKQILGEDKQKDGKDKQKDEKPNVYERGERTPKTKTDDLRSQEIEISALSATPQYSGLSFMPKPFESTATRAGEKMHYLMESVHSPEDFDRLFGGDETYSELVEAFHHSLANPTVRQWFAPPEGWQVYTEPQFYSPKSGRTIRADRVMLNDTERQAIVLDYKFGEPHSAHRHQVAEYMTVMEEMGYSVTGYLWYRFTDLVTVQKR